MTDRLSLEEVVQKLEELLPGNVTVEIAQDPKVRQVLEAFDPAADDTWQDYAIFDEQYPYTRNLIAVGADYDLILLCWNPGQQSPIHDHPGSNCWMRCVSGELVETRFACENDQVVPIASTTLRQNYMAYINDSLGLHQVSNRTTQPAITLHLYTPRHKQCTTFNLETGKTAKRNSCFHSMFGERVHDIGA
eukprot:c52288_g1_i1.p1 GENE.c52288_g1_i1~~c52288_g1_i1.p1  ORF type:complete len:200 (+),score=19.12 c52288_g1_i1:30-602(+)